MADEPRFYSSDVECAVLNQEHMRRYFPSDNRPLVSPHLKAHIVLNEKAATVKVVCPGHHDGGCRYRRDENSNCICL